MDQKIADAKYRIFRFLSDIYNCFGPILTDNYAVERQWQCYPLVFFNTSILMGIQQCQICIFIQWILFQIQSRRIDMRAKDI